MNKQNEKLIESILNLFKTTNYLQLNEISKLLLIKSSSEQYDELKMTLLYLCDMNILAKSSRRRYSLNVAKIESSLIGTIYFSDNKIFVKTSNPSYDIIYIKKRDLLNAFDKDIVEVKILKEKDNKFFGEVIRVESRAEHIFDGTLLIEDEFYFVRPFETKKYDMDFLVLKENLNGASVGQKVQASFLNWSNPNKLPTAKITKFFKNQVSSLNIKTEIDKIVKEYGLIETFPEEVIEEAKNIQSPKIKNPTKIG